MLSEVKNSSSAQQDLAGYIKMSEIKWNQTGYKDGSL